MRERRETLSFLSFLPRRERPLLAGKDSDVQIQNYKNEVQLKQKLHQLTMEN